MLARLRARGARAGPGAPIRPRPPGRRGRRRAAPWSRRRSCGPPAAGSGRRAAACRLRCCSVSCSSKSTCSVMPAISTQRRSCSSPHWPRVCGWRSAFFRPAVSELRLPTVCPICSSRVRVCRSVSPRRLHLGLDLLLALGDPLGQRLDLGLALVERRLGRLARRACATPRSSAAGRRRPSRSPPGSPARGRAARPAPRGARDERVDEPRGEERRRRWRARWSRPPIVTSAARRDDRRRDAGCYGAPTAAGRRSRRRRGTGRRPASPAWRRGCRRR